MYTNLVVLFLLSTSPTGLMSTNPSSFKLAVVKLIQVCEDSFKYLITQFTTSQYGFARLLINRLTTPTT